MTRERLSQRRAVDFQQSRRSVVSPTTNGDVDLQAPVKVRIDGEWSKPRSGGDAV